MKELIRSFDFTKSSTKLEIETALEGVEDYSSNYYSIKRMCCNSYSDCAKEIYEYLQTL